MHRIWVVPNGEIDQYLPDIQHIDKKCFSKKDSVIMLDKKEISKASTILVCAAMSVRIVGYVLLSHTRQNVSLRILKVYMI